MIRRQLVGLSLALVVACRGHSDSARNSASTAGAGPSALEASARKAVAFLQGSLPFDSLALADTVELRVAPEGGGAVSRVPRAGLRDPATWVIGDGARAIHLSPPAGYSAIALAQGQHYRCQPQALEPVAPDWGQRPHVGVRLQPGDATSCLQSWNVTLVFDTLEGRARLAGLLYDQWEW